MTSQTTHGACGPPPTVKDTILETGASATQSFEPIKAICAHLNAFHVYASDPSRHVEANHYCTHLSADVRQCLIYDAPTNPARLIGVEYMITKRLYEGLDEAERKLWHSHDYEVCNIFWAWRCSPLPSFRHIRKQRITCSADLSVSFPIGPVGYADNAKPKHCQCSLGDCRDGRNERGNRLVWKDVSFLAD